jgi:hypothetical protein
MESFLRICFFLFLDDMWFNDHTYGWLLYIAKHNLASNVSRYPTDRRYSASAYHLNSDGIGSPSFRHRFSSHTFFFNTYDPHGRRLKILGASFTSLQLQPNRYTSKSMLRTQTRRRIYSQ